VAFFIGAKNMSNDRQITDNPNENLLEQPNVTEQPKPTDGRVKTAEQEPASFPPAYQMKRLAKGRGRPSLKMTREQLMTAIGECTEALGHVPSHAELMRSGKVSGRQIVKHFGTYTRALRACNLERSNGRTQSAAGEAVSGLGKGGAGG
jgi:Homing endonuclease associated repeat